ncbi:hypothetical protein GL304_16765 [Nocardia seriolae]|nr:hypothetical protein [Nocardia seriolae]
MQHEIRRQNIDMVFVDVHVREVRGHGRDPLGPDAAHHTTGHRHPGDMGDHHCIVLRENESDYALWRFVDPDGSEFATRVAGDLVSNDGDVITRWCLESRGLTMRSLWQVAPLLADGTLTQVMPDLSTPAADICAAYAAGPALPRRTRALLEHLRAGLRSRISGE